MRRDVAFVFLMLLGAAVLLMVLFLAAKPADAHERWVFLHDHNDAGRVTASHAGIQACDGTRNGHPFGVQGRTASGKIATTIESDPDQQCGGIYNPDNYGDFTHIRWYCHGDVGPWRAT